MLVEARVMHILLYLWLYRLQKMIFEKPSQLNTVKIHFVTKEIVNIIWFSFFMLGI